MNPFYPHQCCSRKRFSLCGPVCTTKLDIRLRMFWSDRKQEEEPQPELTNDVLIVEILEDTDEVVEYKKNVLVYVPKD
ncbi:hypothetical protein pipiens_008857 [Culex pipiens pipiens]|uniref:Uncharacterized protein n=1 Tax=Culex pipiens pipiens TaxID=38569 RepID=A0ABD1DFW2_CULPP